MNKKIIRNIQQLCAVKNTGKFISLYSGETFKVTLGEGDSVSVQTSRGINIYKTDVKGNETFLDDRYRAAMEAISHGQYMTK
jgi:hypothetical protein